MAIDFSFIRELEGFETEGYVPQNEEGVLGQSGVTIGSGIDLGQWSRKQLESIGVSKAILNKIEPYLGKKKEVAVGLLEQKPLQLSKEEAEELTTAVKKEYSAKVKRWYNRNNTADNDWSDLTDRQQTSITSVAFQYGVGSKNTPKFNKQVLSNNWEGLVEELKNFGDDYDTRRHKELQYLVGTPTDGVIGPQTEQAIDRFVTTQEVMTPDAPQPQAPQLEPMGFLDNLTEILRQRLNAPQEQPQEPETPVSESEEQINPLVRSLADHFKSKRGQNEAKLERTANEAKLEAEAKAAGYKPSTNPLVQALSKTEVIKSRVYDRSNLNVPTEEAPTEELAGGQDASKDPIFGIF